MISYEIFEGARKRLLGLGKGTYALVLKLGEEHIRIGKLGTFDFQKGFYIYVGSALGSGGLAGRLKHHLLPVKRPHWHIDYLRDKAQLKQIWCVEGEDRREHQWWHLLQTLEDTTVPVIGFGSSDCSCIAHLIHMFNNPKVKKFCELLKQGFPEDNTLEVFHMEMN